MKQIILKIWLIYLVFNASVFGRDIILISDVDDTLKRTHVLGYFTGGVFTKNAYVGLNKLYSTLLYDKKKDFQKNNYLFNQSNYDSFHRTVFYVSGAPGCLSNFGKRFLKNSKFPKGKYYHRPNMNISTKVYKVNAITTILNDISGPADIILVGDNGEYDPEVYRIIENIFKKRDFKFHTFIHQIYSYELGTGEEGSPLLKGQRPFLTAVELALYFYQAGFISSNNLQKIYNLSSKFLFSTKKKKIKKIIPKWTRCLQFINTYRRPEVSLEEDFVKKLDAFDEKVSSICLNLEDH